MIYHHYWNWDGDDNDDNDGVGDGNGFGVTGLAVGSGGTGGWLRRLISGGGSVKGGVSAMMFVGGDGTGGWSH